MRKFIRYHALIPTIMISALSSGAFVSTIITPTYATQAPGNQDDAKISYDDFIAKMGDVLTQKDRMPRANQQNAIQNLFSQFNFVNDQNKDLIVNSIYDITNQRLIVREQAEALMTYIDNKLDMIRMPAPLDNKADLLTEENFKTLLKNSGIISELRNENEMMKAQINNLNKRLAGLEDMVHTMRRK